MAKRTLFGALRKIFERVFKPEPAQPPPPSRPRPEPGGGGPINRPPPPPPPPPPIPGPQGEPGKFKPEPPGAEPGEIPGTPERPLNRQGKKKLRWISDGSVNINNLPEEDRRKRSYMTQEDAINDYRSVPVGYIIYQNRYGEWQVALDYEEDEYADFEEVED